MCCWVCSYCYFNIKTFRESFRIFSIVLPVLIFDHSFVTHFVLIPSPDNEIYRLCWCQCTVRLAPWSLVTFELHVIVSLSVSCVCYVSLALNQILSSSCIPPLWWLSVFVAYLKFAFFVVCSLFELYLPFHCKKCPSLNVTYGFNRLKKNSIFIYIKNWRVTPSSR